VVRKLELGEPKLGGTLCTEAALLCLGVIWSAIDDAVLPSAGCRLVCVDAAHSDPPKAGWVGRYVQFTTSA